MNRTELLNKIENLTLRVEMPDGGLWDISALAIAQNKTKSYLPEETTVEVFETTLYDTVLPLFVAKHSEITDWASNRMKWADIRDSATFIKYKDRPVPCFEEAWADADKTILKEVNYGKTA